MSGICFDDKRILLRIKTEIKHEQHESASAVAVTS